MIIRIAIPTFLWTATFIIFIAGFVFANQATLLDQRYESSIVKLKERWIANRSLRTKAEIWRVLEARAKTLSRSERGHVADLVIRYSIANNHDPLLLLALIETESNFRRDVVSKKGAVGLMQIRPFVAQGLADELNMSPDEAVRLVNIDVNVKIGSYYLAKMVKRFGNLSLALEAYNQGPTKLRDKLRKGALLNKRYTRKVFRSRNKLKAILRDTV
ncbi:hypothetical protein MNBD_NITROSPINAE03-553 [hydrothermal vent metagenome]|uniref:Transglycosylase SLT domain-containing protein n=1 Tax=hydrothermal vent metagenome TaxID=652676 RepID=A0A3B1C9Z1_9ZZZZ